MNKQNIKITRALLSVSNKTGIVEFAQGLAQLGIEIISTGGTSELLRKNNIAVQDVSDVTQFPEMMDGRVKTLHPKIHGGILGLRDEHAVVAAQHEISWIDLVVVNLYPFAETIKKPNVTLDDAIENIDIGGPTMLRSAAKNVGWVGVVVDPQDYSSVLTSLQKNNGLSFAERYQLAAKVFAHTAHYDAIISQHLNTETFPEKLSLTFTKNAVLRYGENPHQAACAYSSPLQTGILSAQQKQGKELSYNNIVDANAAVNCVNEFMQPACVIVKHANPCGAAWDADILKAYQQALAADSLSAFGGIVALNRHCDKKTAEAIAQTFFEVIIAPAYAEDALEVFAAKPNLRVLSLADFNKNKTGHTYKFVDGGLLIQDKDTQEITEKDLTVVTTRKPTPQEMHDLLFAWRVVKHIKSNAILIAKNNATVGMGAGQVSRVDAVDLALRKAGENLQDTVLASDAFFPFRDSIDHLKNSGICAIIQPGGSVRDEEVIAACDEQGIAMVFTGKRCFNH